MVAINLLIATFLLRKVFNYDKKLAYGVKWTITILPYNEITIKLRNTYRFSNEIYYCRNLVRVVVKFITVQNSFKFNNKQISNVGARDMTPKTNKFDIYREKFSLL